MDATTPRVPFTFFVSLLREISSSLRPRPNGHRVQSREGNLARDIFRCWVTELHRRFGTPPPGTTAAVFRLLFPEDDVHRKYGMQEPRLARLLSDCLGLDAGPLVSWCEPNADAQVSSGCLGLEVQKALECRHANPDEISSLSILEVDSLLDELAACCAFSASHIRFKNASRHLQSMNILRALYRNLPPMDSAVVTQIILKDLRTILYPVHETHYTSALKDYNAKAIRSLSREDAMWLWDPSGCMYRAYKASPNLGNAAMAFEHCGNDIDEAGSNGPKVGSFIPLPKSEKARDPKHALRMLQNSKEVWAETKYDGERAQIHVTVPSQGDPRITIFSKSQRNSTWDRVAIHPLILEALSLTESSSKEGARTPNNHRIITNVVLDAEMVAYRDDHIDEFWRIRSLIESTAQGVRGRKRIHPDASNESETTEEVSHSQSSLASDISESQHLSIVFFDILVLDSVSLLGKPYKDRRALLESLICPVPHHVMLAERSSLRRRDPLDSLCSIFADSISERKEGLVLKAAESLYGDRLLPWVKVKRDYIPGHGDCVDLLVLGAGWDKDRARELRVPVDTFTTFYIGALANSEDILKKLETQPHFLIFFTVSYGFTREQLEEANFLLKNSDSVQYPLGHMAGDTLSYTFNIFKGLQPPRILLCQPLVAELFGAGFTKSPKARQYELRFPRITKLHRRAERSWKDAVTLGDFHKIAREVVGRDREGKDLEDWCKSLWGKPASPSVKSAGKRKRLKDEWVKKLRAVSGLPMDPDPSDSGEEIHEEKFWDSDIELSKNHSQNILPVEKLEVRTMEEASIEDKEDAMIVHGSPLSQRTNLPTLSPLRPAFSLADPDTFHPARGFAVNVPDPLMLDVRTPKRRKITNRKNLYPSPITSPLKAPSGAHEESNDGVIDKSDVSATRHKNEPQASNSDIICTSPNSVDTGMKAFLADSLVWFARTRRVMTKSAPSLPKASDATVVPSATAGARRKTMIPSGQRLHSLESLLLGCGWGSPTSISGTHHTAPSGCQDHHGCLWARQGVIFVDQDPWLGHVKRTLEERRASLRCAHSKPIFVFHANMLSYVGEVVERNALYQLR